MTDINLAFVNNSAGTAGTVLYGGEFETCSIFVGGRRDMSGNIQGEEDRIENATIDYVRSISTIVSNDTVTSDIASEPIMVCSCNTGRIECPLSLGYSDFSVVRGQEFTLQVAAVGQGRGAVPSAVRVNLDNSVRINNPSQRIQFAGKGCSTLTYSLLSESNTTRIILTPVNSPCSSAIIDSGFEITFLPCPAGFNLEGSECVCDARLRQFDATCNISDTSIKRVSNTFWMGALCGSLNRFYEGLILHDGYMSF